MDKPNILDRLKLTYRFFKQGSRYMTPRRDPSRASMSMLTWPGETKDAPFIWPAWRMGKPQWQIVNYEGYAQEGFNENAVIYSAIMYKVRSITISPLRAYKGTVDEPELLDADHPLQRLAARPNPHMSWSEFQGVAEIYFNLAGNCYIYAEPQSLGGTVPKALWLLRPDRTYIIPHPDFRGKTMKFHPMWKAGEEEKREDKALLIAGGKALKAKDDDEKLLGFYYVPEGRAQADGIPYLPQQIMHIKLPNPLDPLDGLGYGLSPISPMARSADVDNQVTKYLKLFFEKGAMPPGLLSYDMPLDDPDVARAREQWMAIYGGVDEMHKIGILDQGGKYQRLGLSFDEMGFEVIDERSESRIMGPFGVPPILTGTRLGLGRATYANYQEARKAFWEDTMTPELRWFETEYQYYLQGDEGEFVMFDLSKVPALMPTPKERVEWATEAFGRGGITRNEYRSVIGFDPVEGGDIYVMPMMLIESPVHGSQEEPTVEEEDTQEGMPEATEEAEGKEKKQSRMNAEQKVAFWKQMDAQARSWEKRFGDAAAEAFRTDLREILVIVNEGKAKALENKQTVDWNMVLMAVGTYLAVEATKNWRAVFTPLIGGLIVDRTEQLNAEFGMEFQAPNLLTEAWFEEYTLTFAQPILDTTEKQMSAMFQQAMSEGWSIPTTSKNLETIFQQWMDGDLSAEDFAWFAERMPPYRREMIARTESLRASNVGSEALYRNWGVQQKEWLAAMDDRTRDAHAAASGQVVPINAAFNVGGESLRFPGDPQGSEENTIMCRCTVIPVI